MDNLQPLSVRLRASTIDALKTAQAESAHRSLASFVDDILRQHLIDGRRDAIERTISNARQHDAEQHS